MDKRYCPLFLLDGAAQSQKHENMRWLCFTLSTVAIMVPDVSMCTPRAGALELRGFPRGKLVGKADALRSLEEKCMELMHTVKLKYLVEREGGWRVTKHWSTRLSLGEQQRVGMARLFHHRCGQHKQSFIWVCCETPNQTYESGIWLPCHRNSLCS